MYDFRTGRRLEPYELDPMGVSYERLMNPNPSMEGFQFTQNPETPMTMPQMGLGLGGAPETPNFMQMNLQDSPSAMGGAGSAGAMMGLAKLAGGGGGNEQPIPQAHATLPGIHPIDMNFIIPLMELELSRRKKKQ